MNFEHEAYAGELRELRSRQIKLAKVITLLEEKIQGGIAAGPTLRQPILTQDVERMLSDPEIADWMDKMRHEGKVPYKRFSSTGMDDEDAELNGD